MLLFNIANNKFGGKMFKKFKKSFILLASLLVSFAVISCGGGSQADSSSNESAAPEGSVKIIVVSHGQANDPFWSVVKNAVDQAAQDYANIGLDVSYRAPSTFDMVEMARLIDQAVAEGPDGLVVSLPDANALGPSIKRAVAAGIPVVSMNSGSDDFEALGILAHVGQTEYEAGLGAGKKMKALGATKAIIVNHEVGNVALDKRGDGFKEGFGQGEVLATSNDPTEIQSSVTSRLNSDPSIDAILTLGAGAAGDHVLDVLEQLGKTSSVKLGTFDLSGKMLTAASEGKVAFLIDQQQYLQGYIPIVILIQYNRYGTILPGIVPTGPGFVTPENAANVISWAEAGYR